jgi:hypothetical protein
VNEENKKERKVERKKKLRNNKENRAARKEQGIKKERKIAKMHARNKGQGGRKEGCSAGGGISQTAKSCMEFIP